MPTVCGSNKIDSNVVGLSIAEEVCLKVLPTVAAGDGLPVWHEQEPNSFSDFGGDITTVARSPISRSRQRRKGTVVDLDASGGFQMDITKSNLQRLMQGFCFADAREQAKTIPMNGTPIVITSVSASTGYNAAASLDRFAVRDIVLASGFTSPANNGMKVLTAASATALMAVGVVAEATPPAAAKLHRVGKVGVAADLSITVAGGVTSLVSASNAMPSFGNSLIPGAWLFLGGDDATSQFANNQGYACVKSISASAIVFDKTTWNPVAESGAGKSIQIFVGNIVRNESDPTLIKRRSYQLERTLGNDAAGVQSEYVIGAVANKCTVNLAQADKITLDMEYVGCDVQQRTGLQGLKEGTRVAARGEDAFNTSSDVYRIKLGIQDPNSTNPQALFGYVTDGTIDIDNGVTPSKAIGVMGAFDTTAGDFMVSGSLTAFFTTVEATRAVRQNADVYLYQIFASKNSGFIFDIPLLSLGGGRIGVEKDKEITVPIDQNAAQSAFGHTLLTEFFDYLPTLAMPTV